MSKLIKFSVGEESYRGLIYDEEDLYEHVKLRLAHNMKEDTIHNSHTFDFSKIDESYILLSRKQNFSLYDLVIFIDDNFNIKEMKNTYSFKEDQISEILFSQI
jgi:hypothetical protein